MKLRTHTCAATGCQHLIGSRLLMCIDHWRMVPIAIRREVLQAVKDMRVDRRNLDVVTRYRDAVARAVAAVEEKQERKAVAQAGPSGSLFT